MNNWKLTGLVLLAFYFMLLIGVGLPWLFSQPSTVSVAIGFTVILLNIVSLALFINSKMKGKVE